MDYENQNVYDVRVKGINRYIDERFLTEETRFEDATVLRIRVQDVDEPPVFISNEFMMEILEEDMNNSFVGAVSAKDPDQANSPIRYGYKSFLIFLSQVKMKHFNSFWNTYSGTFRTRKKCSLTICNTSIGFVFPRQVEVRTERRIIKSCAY